jgi:hypothetical protein
MIDKSEVQLLKSSAQAGPFFFKALFYSPYSASSRTSSTLPSVESAFIARFSGKPSIYGFGSTLNR